MLKYKQLSINTKNKKAPYKEMTTEILDSWNVERTPEAMQSYVNERLAALSMTELLEVA